MFVYLIKNLRLIRNHTGVLVYYDTAKVQKKITCANFFFVKKSNLRKKDAKQPIDRLFTRKGSDDGYHQIIINELLFDK